MAGRRFGEKNPEKFLFKPPKKPAKEEDVYRERYVTTKIGVNLGKVG